MAVGNLSTANYLVRSALVYATRPFAMRGWGYRTAAMASSAITQGTNNDNDHRWFGGVFTAQGVLIGERTTVNQTAITAGASPTDTWFHMAFNFVSPTLREVEMDGAQLATNVNSLTPNAPNNLKIGVNQSLTGGWDINGGLAEFTIHDEAGFTEPNRRTLTDKLAAGENPLIVDLESGQPWTASLVAYWRLRSKDDLADLTGNGHDLSIVGTVNTFSSHPPVMGVGGASVGEGGNASAVRGGNAGVGGGNAAFQKLRKLWVPDRTILLPTPAFA